MSIHHQIDLNAGAAGATWRLAEAFRSLGHEVDILSFDDINGPEKIKRLRFPWFVAREIRRRASYDVYDLSSGDGWVASSMRPLAQHRTKSIIVSRSNGLEHVFHDAYIAEMKAQGRRPSWKYPLYSGSYRLWEIRQAHAQADLSLFLNTFDQDYAIERLGVRRERTARVINGVADYLIEHAHTIEPLPHAIRPARIAFIGSYIERKGIRILRDAMASVMGRHDYVHLEFLGTGLAPELTLKDYPNDLHARIAVTPRYNNLELPRLLRECHIFAFPSLSEGFPLAIAEAMSCGLVPIVADTSGPNEIVEDGQNGLVVARADATALQAAIERLLVDPMTWNRLRRAAITDVNRYSWPVVAAQTLDLYSRLLAS